MSITLKQLGQSNPANTTAASIYSPPTGYTAVIKEIVVCNTTASAVTFQVCLDTDGTTYTAGTAHFWNVSLAGNTSVQLSVQWGMSNTAGNLSVQTGTSSALTFSVYGSEISS